jgi:dinuclear metal center YbgI/SA1388 family protein
MVRVKDILDWIDAYAPFRYAESWDNCGLLVGDPEACVERVLTALDVSSETLSEAEKTKSQCLVTHHPLLLNPIKSVRLDSYPGNLVARALKSGINLIAAHTNLDAAREGTNGRLSRILSLEMVGPLEVDPTWKHEETYGGMGRVGFLPKPMPLKELVEGMREPLGQIDIRVAGNPEQIVHKVALCTGSGGSLIRQAFAAGSQAYITGDLKYHDAQWALEVGLALVDIGHFASERLIAEPLAEYLRSRSLEGSAKLEVIVAMQERDPFWYKGKSF